MASPKILRERIAHLEYDLMLLRMSIPVAETEEQKEHIEKKGKFLRFWIDDLKELLEQDDD